MDYLKKYINSKFYFYFQSEYIEKNKYLYILESYIHSKVYCYGANISLNPESRFLYYKALLSDLARELLVIVKILAYRKETSSKSMILSTAYFSINDEFEKIGFNARYAPWRISGSKYFLPDLSYTLSYYSFKRKLDKLSFYELISGKGEDLSKRFVDNTVKCLKRNGINAVVTSSTISYLDRTLLVAAEELNIKRFTFLHGLPGRYAEDWNLTDYLVVWSDKIKENFCKISDFPASQILVSGHPFYKNFSDKKLTFDISKILVITYETSTIEPHDRGAFIFYLFSIQKVLTSNGVTKVKFRPHPGRSVEWYMRHVDTNFFSPDMRSLKEAIVESSMLIGPPSTLMLESIYYGKNYLVYNPIDNKGKELNGHKPVPPFDGEDILLPVATNEEQFQSLLDKKVVDSIGVLSEYIKTPFNISFMKGMI